MLLLKPFLVLVLQFLVVVVMELWMEKLYLLSLGSRAVSFLPGRILTRPFMRASLLHSFSKYRFLRDFML
jgi:hypothetical protein